MKINSIRTKLILMIMAVIVVFGALAIVMTYRLSVEQLTFEKKKSSESLVAEASKLVEENILASQRLVERIAKNKDFVKVLISEIKTTDEINERLANFNLGNLYSAIYLIDKQGVVKASTEKSFLDQNYGFRQYFIKAIEGQAYSDVNLGVTSGKLGFYFSYPVKNEEEIVGVAVVKMEMDYIADLIRESIKEPITDLMLIDRYGVVVVAVQPGRVYKSFEKLNKEILAELEKENKYPNLEILPLDFGYILNKEPMSNGQFFLAGELSLKDIEESATKMAGWLGLMVAAAVIGAIVLLLILISRFSKPLERLSVMASEIGAGNFSIENTVNRNDELGLLGRTMEIAAKSLASKYDEMEKIVAERTVKLRDQNLVLEKSKLAMMNISEDLNKAVIDLEKYKLAVENASDHMVITDSEGIVLFANRAVEKITGYGIDEVIGKKAGSGELWGGLMEKSFYEKLWKTIKIDKKTFSGEINNKRKNGDQYVAMASISPVLDKNGEVEFLVGIERDITREKEVDRMKTEFISLASHQLRTPLSAMKWFSEMLLAGDAGKLTDEQKEYVGNIAESNERMIALVNSLLNISRIEAGRIVIDPKPTDMAKLVTGVVKEIEQKIKEKKQTLIVDINPKLPLINIDPKLIFEVFKNLLTNACKYTANGGEICILVSKNDKEIICQVTDNGYGIPKKDQGKAFDKFYRGENILKLETDGNGLGLYLAKAIVESSGGKIWFKSEEGVGTTFWFSLPLTGSKAKKGTVSINS